MAAATNPLSRFFGLRRGLRVPVFDRRAILVGIGCVALAAVARILLEQVVHGLVPFVLTFPIAIVATLAAGAGAGGIALIGCQLLTLLFVLPHWRHGEGPMMQQVVNFTIATVSLAFTVWAASSYRRLSGSLRAQCEREVGTLSLLINEMDHRTKNNFQIAASLLAAQAARSGHAEVREALDRAAGRLVSMAAVYQHLAQRQPGSGDVSLCGHLSEVCAALRDSLLGPGITVTVAGDEVEVKAASALAIGLVVNEWVTNAAKYAFPGAHGTIAVTVARSERSVTVTVEDDGIGLPAEGRAGTGSRLMAGLIDALGGSTDVQTAGGTHCRLIVPRAAVA